ncbi:MAG: sodium/glutamate symporter [Helicobacteraceae bacterium]|nr:sodium/glutamate symporter [Helicobacteraceae bacterium]
MDYINGVLHFEKFFTVSLAILVLFVGKGLNLRFDLLRNMSIPEPVVGGILFAIFFALLHLVTNISIDFNLENRDFLLIYFFTTIGLSSNFSDIIKGGKPLLILLTITITYMVLQNVIGISVAKLIGIEPLTGLLSGTVSLIGGHGTAIAWAPVFSEKGIEHAIELGIAAATFGLILASLMGGPIASYLINKHDLKPNEEDIQIGVNVGVSYDEAEPKIDYIAFLHAIIAIHVSIMVGYFINLGFEELGLMLPQFVTALFAGILYSTFVMPRLKTRFPWLDWKARNSAMSLIADISLGIFLAMSLMSMQLWVVFYVAGPMLIIIVVQLIFALCFVVFVVFKIMGSNYDAAVIASGFSGISLGSAATAMANMTAVSEKYGASRLAFLVVPLVCAFFMDLANAVLIQSILSIF